MKKPPSIGALKRYIANQKDPEEPDADDKPTKKSKSAGGPKESPQLCSKCKGSM